MGLLNYVMYAETIFAFNFVQYQTALIINNIFQFEKKTVTCQVPLIQYSCLYQEFSLLPNLTELHPLFYLVFQDVVLMRALRDMNLPKFIFEDVPLFLGLIGDLFPGLDCPRVRYPNFNDAVEAILEENGYMMLPVQVCIRHHSGKKTIFR